MGDDEPVKLPGEGVCPVNGLDGLGVPAKPLMGLGEPAMELQA